MLHHIRTGCRLSRFVERSRRLRRRKKGWPFRLGQQPRHLTGVESLETRNLLAADVFEPDDSFEQASVIDASAQVHTHSIDHEWDVDWSKFTISAPSRVVLTTDGTDGATRLRLFEDGRFETYEAIATNVFGNGRFSRIVHYLAPGTYYASVEEYGRNDVINRYTLSVEATPLSQLADPFEGDGTRSQATTLVANAPAQSHNLHYPRDEDWFRFTLDEASNIELTTSGEHGSTTLRLYDDSKEPKLLSYDYSSGSGRFSKISQFLRSGTFYAQLTEYGQNAVIDSYSISLTAVPEALLVDAFERDDDFLSATAIPTDGTPQPHNIHHPNDVDWVSFTLTEAARIQLETEGLEGTTRLRLYDASVTEINRDTYSGIRSFSRIVDYLAAGTYYASVEANRRNHSIDNYVVSVDTTPLSQLIDSFEPDGAADNASVISLDGMPQLHNLHQPDDVDWVTFQLDEAARVELTTSGSQGDTVLQLFQGQTQLARDRDSGDGDFSRIVSHLQPGTYHVAVTEDGQNRTVDTFQLSALATPFSELVDTFESDDQLQTARVIPLDGTSQQHTIHQPADVDWKTFTLAVPSRVVLETNGDLGDTVLRLHDGRREIARDENSGFEEFSLMSVYLDAGTYWVSVEEAGRNWTIDQYTLSAVATPFVELKDHHELDDSPDMATRITANGAPQLHNLHWPGDVDWTRFDVSESSRVMLTTSGDAGDTFLEVFDANQTLLGRNDAGGEDQFSRLTLYLDPGTYFASVKEHGSNATIDEYSVSVSATPLTPLMDAFESDNVRQDATVVVPTGSRTTHSIHRPDDVDWVQFTISRDSRVLIETAGERGETHLHLFDGENRLAQDRRSGDGNFSKILTYLPAGTYHVAVAEAGEDSTIESYNLSVEAVAVELLKDGFEDNNDVTSATPIAPDGTVHPISIHTPADEDWFSFQIAAESRVTLETSGDAGDTRIELYAADDLNRWIDWDDSNGAGSFSQIITVLSPGRYLARVFSDRHAGAIDVFDWIVLATPSNNLRDAYEYDDTPATATPLLADAVAQTHTLHTAEDVDWYRIEVTEGKSRVTIRTGGAAGYKRVRLYAADNLNRSIASRSGDLLSLVELLTPGIYYVSVEYPAAAVELYTIEAEIEPLEQFADQWEADNQPDAASELVPNAKGQQHSIHRPDDVDWMTFSLTQPSYVDIHMSGPGDRLRLHLFASGQFNKAIRMSTRGGRDGMPRLGSYLEAGTYYLAVQSSSAYGMHTGYTIGVAATTAASLIDRYETDDIPDSAVELTEGLWQTRSLHTPNDEDWMRISVDQPSKLFVEIAAVPTPDDGTLEIALLAASNPSETISRRTTGRNAVLDVNVPAGSYLLRVNELGRDSGFSSYDVRFRRFLLPNFSVTSAQAPNSARMGETIRVHWTAANQGGGESDVYRRGSNSWTDAVYLSFDTELGRGDRRLGRRYLRSPSMAPGDDYSASASVTIPNDDQWAGYQLFLLVALDDNGRFDETETADNVVSIPLRVEDYVRLITPHRGSYQDERTELAIEWIARSADPGASVDIAIDSDDDPTNRRGHQFLLQDRPLRSDNQSDQVRLDLPELPSRDEPYWLWVRVQSDQGETYSQRELLVGDRAYRSERSASNAVGGRTYTVHGIEALRVGDSLNFRIRTNYPADNRRGGDLYIRAGDETLGLAVNTHTIADGSQVLRGNLYRNAEFRRGTVVSGAYSFIDSYTAQQVGSSSVEISGVDNEDWRYEITGTLELDEIGIHDREAIELQWTIYCGNDSDLLIIPPRVVEEVPGAVAPGGGIPREPDDGHPGSEGGDGNGANGDSGDGEGTGNVDESRIQSTVVVTPLILERHAWRATGLLVDSDGGPQSFDGTEDYDVHIEAPEARQDGEEPYVTRREIVITADDEAFKFLSVIGNFPSRETIHRSLFPGNPPLEFVVSPIPSLEVVGGPDGYALQAANLLFGASLQIDISDHMSDGSTREMVNQTTHFTRFIDTTDLNPNGVLSFPKALGGVTRRIPVDIIGGADSTPSFGTTTGPFATGESALSFTSLGGGTRYPGSVEIRTANQVSGLLELHGDSVQPTNIALDQSTLENAIQNAAIPLVGGLFVNEARIAATVVSAVESMGNIFGDAATVNGSGPTTLTVKYGPVADANGVTCYHRNLQLVFRFIDSGVKWGQYQQAYALSYMVSPPASSITIDVPKLATTLGFLNKEADVVSRLVHTITHEIGHAFGVNGHSRSPMDVMTPSPFRPAFGRADLSAASSYIPFALGMEWNELDIPAASSYYLQMDRRLQSSAGGNPCAPDDVHLEPEF